jgi:hypothetical protein
LKFALEDVNAKLYGNQKKLALPGTHQIHVFADEVNLLKQNRNTRIEYTEVLL